MDTRDVLTLIGVISVLIVSTINIAITLRNRRNVIREHLFKEQININYKLFVELTKLNHEADQLINNNEKRFENDFENKISIINHFIYENQFILPDDTISLINNLINKSSDYYMKIISTDRKNSEKKYLEYYEAYFLLVKHVRNFFGTDSLSNENKNLHIRNAKLDLMASNVFKHSIDIAQRFMGY